MEAPIYTHSLNDMIAWEEGELDAEGTLNLFAHLIASGLAWQLQGCYGRQAASLIEDGFITPQGEITPEGYAILEG